MELTEETLNDLMDQIIYQEEHGVGSGFKWGVVDTLNAIGLAAEADELYKRIDDLRLG